MEINKEVLRISEDTSKTVKQRVDDLLRLDRHYYINLGSDSTKEERKEVSANSRVIYKAIRGLDKEAGDLFLRAFD